MKVGNKYLMDGKHFYKQGRVAIHKRKIFREKVRKHAFDQEKMDDSRKEKRKHAHDQDLDHAVDQE